MSQHNGSRPKIAFLAMSAKGGGGGRLGGKHLSTKKCKMGGKNAWNIMKLHFCPLRPVGGAMNVIFVGRLPQPSPQFWLEVINRNYQTERKVEHSVFVFNTFHISL